MRRINKIFMQNVNAFVRENNYELTRDSSLVTFEQFEGTFIIVNHNIGTFTVVTHYQIVNDAIHFYNEDVSLNKGMEIKVRCIKQVHLPLDLD